VAADGSANGRHVRRGLGAVLVAIPFFLFAPFFRRRHLRWGASDVELTEAMRGDELVRGSGSGEPSLKRYSRTLGQPTDACLGSMRRDAQLARACARQDAATLA
jgi:hypothetical protein